MTLNAKFLYEQTCKDINTKIGFINNNVKTRRLNKDVGQAIIGNLEYARDRMTETWECMLENEKEKSDKTGW